MHLATGLMAWDSALAEDAVQDVWASLWRSRRRFKGEHGEASLARFLNVCTVNRCRSLGRAQSARAQREARRAKQIDDTTEQNLDPTNSAQETAETIRHAMLRLKATDREIIALYHLQGWSLASVGESLKLKPSACKSRLSRARARLKTLLPQHLREDMP